MFKRLAIDDLQTVFAIVAFILTAAVFAVGIWRAFRMSPKDKNHLASLPLEDGETNNPKDS